MRAIILSGVAFIATRPCLRLPARRMSSRHGRRVRRMARHTGQPYDDRVALVCVLKCAPKRQPCALKNANRAICVPMCAHSSFRRALRNAFLVHSFSIDLERGTDGAPHIR